MATHEEQSVYGGHQVGGNEVFLSFLQALWTELDKKNAPPGFNRSLVRTWGEQIGLRAGLTGVFFDDLDRVAHTLRLMGLVRIFEPLENRGNELDILVLRCLVSRYVQAPRTQKQMPFRPFLSQFVQGILQSAGHAVEVTESQDTLLRTDEQILTIKLSGGV